MGSMAEEKVGATATARARMEVAKISLNMLVQPDDVMNECE